MHHRSIAILAAVFVAFGGGGCASKSNQQYEEVLMPLQTGSTLQRRILVRTDKSPKKKKKKEKKETSTSKPKAEPSATPAPEEESTPPVDRFR
jgi:hypothetical protein